MPRNHLAMFKNVSSPQDAVKCLTQILFKKAADIRACADADLKVDMARQCYPERDSHLQGETYEAEDFPVAHSPAVPRTSFTGRIDVAFRSKRIPIVA